MPLATRIPWMRAITASVFEETLKTRLQGSGASIPKTLQFKTDLFVKNPTLQSTACSRVVHGRLLSDKVLALGLCAHFLTVDSFPKALSQAMPPSP